MGIIDNGLMDKRTNGMDKWTMVNGPNGHHGHHGLWTIAFDHSPWCPLGPLTIVHLSLRPY